MNYWITTIWPRRIDEPLETHDAVYLPDGREAAGRDLKTGDLVFVYEARTGRAEIENDINGNPVRFPRVEGREGVISLLEIKAPLFEDSNINPAKYVDGTELWWKWHADSNVIRNSGFVPRNKLNHILGYKPKYNYRGFGTLHSGLMQITKEQCNAILSAYTSSASIPPIIPKTTHTSSKKKAWRLPVESARHKNLKLYIANNPEKALGEIGIQTIKVEYEFPTCDQADILLKDKYDRIIGLEVEVDVLPNQLAGVLQAVKYKYMAAIMFKRTFEECRSILVAYSICDEIKKVCKKYDVQCIEISSIH